MKELKTVKVKKIRYLFLNEILFFVRYTTFSFVAPDELEKCPEEGWGGGYLAVNVT